MKMATHTLSSTSSAGGFSLNASGTRLAMMVTTINPSYALLSLSPSDSSMILFNVEPESFGTFFDAVYWATVSLTTVGYGDIYPVTAVGRAVTMVSSIFGIAVVALPAGIITAGYMSELNKK